MPIIAVTPPPPAPPSRWADSRALSLRTLEGDDELPWTGGGSYGGGYEWIILPGATGLGVPPVELVTQTFPGLDGAWLREQRVGAREVFVPLVVASDTGHGDYLAKAGRLRRMLRRRDVDLAEQDGTVLLVASSLSGLRQLACTYSSGLEGDESAEQSGTYWQRVGLRLLATDPWWRSADELALRFAASVGTPFLGSVGSGNNWPAALSASVGLTPDEGVTIGGEVPVWPRIDITGPLSTVTLTWAGTSVQIGPVSSAQTLTLNTDPRRRRLRDAADGSSQWSKVGPAPAFAPLMPGSTSVGVVVSGGGAGTEVVVRYRPGWETAW